MKKILNIKSILSVLLLAGLLFTISCEEQEFNYDTLESYHDGIQNLDETGIDCGGNSGTPCPSCTDGIQNQEIRYRPQDIHVKKAHRSLVSNPANFG